MTDMPINEGVALGVAVALALALVSILAYARLAQAGVPARRRRQVVASVWLLVVGLIAVLLALRVVAGGPVVGGSPARGDFWLGLQLRQVITLALAVVLLIVGYVRLRHVLQPLEGGELPVPPTADETNEPDARP